MGGTCNTSGGEERDIQSFDGENEGQRPLRRPRRKLEDNIKMELQEVGRGTWTGLITLRMETDGGHF